jgi:hypothetical protein
MSIQCNDALIGNVVERRSFAMLARSSTRRLIVNLFKTIGDRLLALFLPQIKAGACIPEHGQVCKTLHFDCLGNCK